MRQPHPLSSCSGPRCFRLSSNFWGLIPFPFSSIVLSKTRIRSPWVSGGFLERMPEKKGRYPYPEEGRSDGSFQPLGAWRRTSARRVPQRVGWSVEADHARGCLFWVPFGVNQVPNLAAGGQFGRKRRILVSCLSLFASAIALACMLGIATWLVGNVQLPNSSFQGQIPMALTNWRTLARVAVCALGSHFGGAFLAGSLISGCINFSGQRPVAGTAVERLPAYGFLVRGPGPLAEQLLTTVWVWRALKFLQVAFQFGLPLIANSGPCFEAGPYGSFSESGHPSCFWFLLVSA